MAVTGQQFIKLANFYNQTAMMMSAKKNKPVGIREKAISAADTMGTIMQNIANMVR